ncbi:MAG: hypothetical protein ACQ9ET_03350 [Nitrosomonadaceae bacterium]
MATYYVDFEHGADTNNGTTPTTPFKYPPSHTDASSNAAAASLAAGDSVLYANGTTWIGKKYLIDDVTGTKNNPLTFSNYEHPTYPSDDLPQINAVLTIANTGFTQIGSTDVWYVGYSNNMGGVILDAVPYLKGALSEGPAGDLTFNDNGGSSDTVVSASLNWTTEGFAIGDNVVFYNTSEPSANINDVAGTITNISTTSTTDDTLTFATGTLGGSSTGVDANAVTVAQIDSTYRFAQDDGGNDRLFLYSTADPSTIYTDIWNKTGYSDWYHAIKFTNCSYVVIKNLDIRWGGNESLSYSNEATDTANGLHIEGCQIRTMDLLNTHASHQIADIVIKNNIFDSLSTAQQNAEGLVYSDLLWWSGGSIDALVQGNTFIGSGHAAINLADLTTSYGYNENTVIEYNRFLQGNSVYGRAFGTNQKSARLLNLTFRNNFDNGNQANKLEGENTQIYNNLFSRVDPSSSATYGAWAAETSTTADVVINNIKIYNNTFIGGPSQFIRVSAYTGGTVGTITIKNNIFIHPSMNQATNVRHCFYYDDTATWTDPVVENNIFHMHSAESDVLYDLSTTTAHSLTSAETNFAWAGNTLVDPSLSIDYPTTGYGAPLLELEYDLNTGSPCIGAGTTPLSNKDYHGRQRKGPPDIGAIWFDAHEDSTVEPKPLASGGKR